MSIEEVANLNYLVVILVINLIGFSFFCFSPARKERALRPYINSFMIMFALIGGAFLIFASRLFVPDWLSISLANASFLLSSYYTRNAFMLRRGLKPKPIMQDKLAWINMFVLIGLIMGVFYAYFDSFAARATLTTCNIAILFYISSTYVIRNPEQPSGGELITRFVMRAVACFTPLSAILFWIEQSFFAYMSALMFTQAIAVTGMMGAFLTIILSDLIDMHYKNSVTDPLTDVYNRRFFLTKVPELISDTPDQTKTHSIILADIDDFKKINDKYGHNVGDQALVKFASLIKAHIRNSDVVARFGGEEFVILLSDADTKKAQALAERLCEAVSNYSIVADEQEIRISASFGVSSLEEANEFEKSLQHADQAMYTAKQNGKNQVVVSEAA